MRRMALAGALAGFACFAAGVAQAATQLTPVLSTGPFGTDVSGGVVFLPLFDSHLGTLTSVTISEQGSLTGSADLINHAPQPESFNFHVAGQSGVDIISSDPSAAAADLAGTLFDASLPTVAYNLTIRNTPGSDEPYGPYTSNWGSAISGLPVGDFEQAGGGFVPIHIDVTTFPDASTNAITFNDVFYDELSMEATASLQARYEYIPATIGVIPEPGVWAMMLTGVAAVGAALRGGRRKPAATLAAA